MGDRAPDYLLQVENLGKSFRGLNALQNYQLDLAPGELLGVIGPNGAGKTTLFNLLTGVVPPTSGRMTFAGHDITGMKAEEIARLGIARTFQKVRLFRPLTVRQNLRVALQSRESVMLWDVLLSLPKFLSAEQKLDAQMQDLIDQFDLDSVAGEPAERLSYRHQRHLELACALAMKPRLLLLDEPAAGMNPTETDALMHLILRIHEQMKLTIILIEHNMRVIMNVCKRIQALSYGEIIAVGSAQEIREDTRVIEAYLGHTAEHA